MISKKMSIDISLDSEKRPVAKLVQEASRYESSVYLEYEEKKVNAKSIMGMMSFIAIMSKGIANGEKITIIIDGSDEEAAMENMEKFLTR